jgi:hypothetical protein
MGMNGPTAIRLPSLRLPVVPSYVSKTGDTEMTMVEDARIARAIQPSIIALRRAKISAWLFLEAHDADVVDLVHEPE